MLTLAKDKLYILDSMTKIMTKLAMVIGGGQTILHLIKKRKERILIKCDMVIK